MLTFLAALVLISCASGPDVSGDTGQCLAEAEGKVESILDPSSPPPESISCANGAELTRVSFVPAREEAAEVCGKQQLSRKREIECQKLTKRFFAATELYCQGSSDCLAATVFAYPISGGPRGYNYKTNVFFAKESSSAQESASRGIALAASSAYSSLLSEKGPYGMDYLFRYYQPAF